MLHQIRRTRTSQQPPLVLNFSAEAPSLMSISGLIFAIEGVVPIPAAVRITARHDTAKHVVECHTELGDIVRSL